MRLWYSQNNRSPSGKYEQKNRGWISWRNIGVFITAVGSEFYVLWGSFRYLLFTTVKLQFHQTNVNVVRLFFCSSLLGKWRSGLFVLILHTETSLENSVSDGKFGNFCLSERLLERRRPEKYVFSWVCMLHPLHFSLACTAFLTQL